MADVETMDRPRARVFRENVALYLKSEGFPDARARETGHLKTSDYLRDWPCPDIDGIAPQWLVRTSSAASARLGVELDVAAEAAEFGHYEHSAVVFHRYGGPIHESFALISLEVLAGMLRRDAATWASLAEFEAWLLEQHDREE